MFSSIFCKIKLLPVFHFRNTLNYTRDGLGYRFYECNRYLRIGQRNFSYSTSILSDITVPNKLHINPVSGVTALRFRNVSAYFCREFGQPAAQTHPHLLNEGDVTPGISRQEYKVRRENLVESIKREKLKESSGCALAENDIVIIPSATTLYMSNDIPYPFRQNTDFLYLSGFLEPNSILVLHTLNKSSQSSNHTSVLFVPKRDPHKELWDGPRSGSDGSVRITGVDEAFDSDKFDTFMTGLLSQATDSTVWYDSKVSMQTSLHTNINRLLESFSVRQQLPVRKLVHLLRLIKSSAEVEVMRKSGEIASESFIETMKYSQPKINEANLYAKMDFECRVRGAEFLAYPPVVAGGDRANIIHYINNNQLIEKEELVLMDAGCEYHGYTSDITRTWPVGGAFTSIQLELYEALLEVQLSCVKLCRADASLTLDRLYMEMLTLIGRQLQRMGIASQSLSSNEIIQMARSFCPHHVSHYLGMDVHDTDLIPRNVLLTPGMIITVEPGLYISKSTQLPVPQEMKGIGMRIEDDVLITSSEPLVLSSSCPKHPLEIERIMASRSWKRSANARLQASPQKCS